MSAENICLFWYSCPLDNQTLGIFLTSKSWDEAIIHLCDTALTFQKRHFWAPSLRLADKLITYPGRHSYIFWVWGDFSTVEQKQQLSWKEVNVLQSSSIFLVMSVNSFDYFLWGEIRGSMLLFRWHSYRKIAVVFLAMQAVSEFSLSVKTQEGRVVKRGRAQGPPQVTPPFQILFTAMITQPKSPIVLAPAV